MRIFFSSVVVASALFASVALAQTATSTTTGVISFPIPELGNCASKQECKAYCDDASHKEACLAYAQARGLMTKAKADTARLIIKKQGPGGCTSKEECRAYCADETHRDECYNFAVKNGLKSQDEASRDKSFQNTLKTVGGPGGCTDTQTCRAYCAQAANQTECKAFAELHGFMRLRQQMASTTNFGSTTPPRKLGTSTQRMLPYNAKPGMSSTTGPAKMGSTTRPLPPGQLKQMPQQNADGVPTTYIPRTSLGAGVAFILELLGW